MVIFPGAVVSAGPRCPSCPGDLAIDPDKGLPIFGPCVRALQTGLGEFMHGVVVHRRDESIRSWCNWILEVSLVHLYRWLWLGAAFSLSYL